MNSMPLISVVIPTYNYAIYLPRAIESVLVQTYEHFELIIVDDGSTDNTAAVMEAYKSRYPDRIHYIYQKNGGPNAARNKGIDSAQGEFVALLDADDEWFPDKLAKQISFALENTNVGMIGCGFRWVKDDGTIICDGRGESPPPRCDLIRYLKIRNFNFGGSSGVLIKKECFRVVGKFDESLKGSEDRDMWLRIANQFEIMNLPDILVVIHYHDTNCHTDHSRMLNSRFKFIDKHFNSEDFKFKQRAFSFAYLDAAHECFKANLFIKAAFYSLLAICCFPLKSVPDDDKYQILVKSILPNWVLLTVRSKRSSH